MNPNTRLRMLYKKHWPSINKCMKDIPNLSGPTVIDIPDSYFNSRTKLMIIGQQTFGWNRGSLERLLKDYRDFNFGEKWYQSPFWNMTSKITTILGVSRYSIAWTNLVKCEYKKQRPPENIEEKVQSAFPVLSKEISILSPDLVLFFTGPNYDERLLRSLPRSSFEKVGNYPERYLTQVSSPSLPKNSFRTYHPQFLRRSGKEKNFLNFIKRIM